MHIFPVSLAQPDFDSLGLYAHDTHSHTHTHTAGTELVDGCFMWCLEALIFCTVSGAGVHGVWVRFWSLISLSSYDIIIKTTLSPWRSAYEVILPISLPDV